MLVARSLLASFRYRLLKNELEKTDIWLDISMRAIVKQITIAPIPKAIILE